MRDMIALSREFSWGSYQIAITKPKFERIGFREELYPTCRHHAQLIAPGAGAGEAQGDRSRSISRWFYSSGRRTLVRGVWNRPQGIQD
jgi:hypothetical protein